MANTDLTKRLLLQVVTINNSAERVSASYLSDRDDARAEALVAAFHHPETKAVLCARGDY